MPEPRLWSARTAGQPHGLSRLPAHLEPVHQLQGLAVILVGFEDDIGQLVDDDIQGALLLNRPAEVQLRAGDTEKEQLEHLSPCPSYPRPLHVPAAQRGGSRRADTPATGQDGLDEAAEVPELLQDRPRVQTSVPEPQTTQDTENAHGIRVIYGSSDRHCGSIYWTHCICPTTQAFQVGAAGFSKVRSND